MLVKQSYFISLVAILLVTIQGGLASPDNPSDNSPRQIAMATRLAHFKGQVKRNAPEPRLNYIRLAVPADVQEAYDSCAVAAGKVSRVFAHRMLEALNWLNAICRQMNSTPAMTPAGSPYTGVVSQYAHHLYLGLDGRLKSVVLR